jgi:hypothetical protein
MKSDEKEEEKRNRKFLWKELLGLAPPGMCLVATTRRLSQLSKWKWSIWG